MDKGLSRASPPLYSTPRTLFLPPAARASQLKNCPWPRLHGLTGACECKGPGLLPQFGVTLKGHSGSGPPCGVVRQLLGLPCSSTTPSARASNGTAHLSSDSRGNGSQGLTLSAGSLSKPAAIALHVKFAHSPLPVLSALGLVISTFFMPNSVNPLKAGTMLSTSLT